MMLAAITGAGTPRLSCSVTRLSPPASRRLAGSSVHMVEVRYITTRDFVSRALIQHAGPALDEFARAWPGRIGMRIIRRPHQSVGAVFRSRKTDVPGLELEGPPYLAFHVFARQEL